MRNKNTMGVNPWIFIIIVFLLSFSYPAYALAGGTLVIGLPYEAQNFDPAYFQNPADIQVIRCTCENLVDYVAGGDYLPSLARKWHSSSDFKTWTFYLKENVFFHDKTVFNAHAVKFNIERIIQPLKNKEGFGLIFLNPKEDLKEIEVLDKYTLKFKFNRAYPNLLKVLALPQFAVISPKALKKSKSSIYPVGTGPFYFVEQRKEHRIVLERNDDYRGKLPKIKRIIFEPVLNAQYRQSLFEKGFIDILVGFKSQDKVKLKAGAKLVENKIGARTVLFFNCIKPPFDKYSFRDAVSASFSQDLLKQLDVFEHTQDFFYKYDLNKNIKMSKGIKFKIDKARGIFQLFNKKNDEIVVVISKHNDMLVPDIENIADKISFILDLVGARHKILLLSEYEAREKNKKGDFHILIDWIADCPLYKDYFFLANLNQELPFIEGYNRCFYKNDKLNEVLSMQNYLVDSEQIEECSSEAYEEVFQDIPLIELYRGKRCIGIKDNIVDLYFDSFGYLDLSKVWQK